MSLQTSHGPVVDDEINLRHYWHTLSIRRELILKVIGVFVFVALLLSLLQLNIYQSKVVLLPLATQDKPLGGLGILSGLLAGGGAGAADSPLRLVAILQSRSLAEDVIRQLDLLPLLFPQDWDIYTQQWLTNAPPTMQDTVKRLGTLVSSSFDVNDGTIAITAEHADAVLAASIANQYVEALQRALHDSAFSLAKKKRLFLDSQIQKIQQDLVSAEEANQHFEQKYGILALDTQTQAMVNTLAEIESQIMLKEVQLGVLQRSYTASNQEVYLLQEELQELRKQLLKLQRGLSDDSPDSVVQRRASIVPFPLEQTPDVKLQYARLQREILLQSKLFAVLAEQHEQAKIEEARDETSFQIIDSAIPSEKKVRPKRLINIMFAIVLGAFVGICGVLFLGYLDTRLYTREQVEQEVGLTLLGALPPVASPQRRGRRQKGIEKLETVVASPLQTSTLEALRYVHLRLKHLDEGQQIQSLLLASPRVEEPVTQTLVNLAMVAASYGESILLIDCNFHHPTLHKLCAGVGTTGLAEFLLQTSETIPAHKTIVENLYLIPTGRATPEAFAALESSMFDTLLAKCQETYALILLAAPPVLGSLDATIISSKVNATCLVLTCGVSRRDTALEAYAALQTVQAHVIGAILTDFQPSTPPKWTRAFTEAAKSL